MNRAEILKKQDYETDNKEENKHLIKESDMLLKDDELEQVNGGKWKVGPGGMVYWVDNDSTDVNIPGGNHLGNDF